MVERMKKITFFIFHADKEKFLSRLQKIGAVHIDKISSGTDPAVAESEKRLGQLMKELVYLSDLEKKTGKESGIVQKKFTGWEQFLKNIDSDRVDLAGLIDRKEHLENEIEKIEPWGEIDQDIIRKLQEEGVQIKLYTVNRAQFNRMNKSDLPMEIISQDKTSIYFMTIYPKGIKPQAIDAKEESIPKADLLLMESELKNVIKSIQNQKEKLFSYIQYIDSLKMEIFQSRNNLIWNLTNSNFKPEAENSIYIAVGWVPERLCSEVQSFLNDEHAAYIVEDPGKNDKVPISLKNNAFMRLFEPIMKIFSLPDYMELDTTPFFAPFYMIFFGLCVADAGYGIILFIAAVIIFIFIKNKAFKPLIMLGIFLSLSVLTGGLLVDDFFGVHLLEVKSLPGIIKAAILFPGRNDMMSLAIMLGIVQILFGFLIRIFNQVRKHGLIGALMPAGTIMLLSGSVMAMVCNLAKGLKIGPIPVYKLFSSIPNAGLTSGILIIGGIGLVLLFNGLEHKIKFYFRPLLGLWELYGLLTGLPGDILSYLRLFALGLAGGLLGHAVLSIAMLVKGNSVFNMLGMSLILILGNALNIAIGLLSAFVHSLRLTFVEFYKSVGFIGGGKAYEPFRLNREEVR